MLICLCFCTLFFLFIDLLQDDVINAGAEYVEGQEVVIDGNIVTSRTPDDLPAFCKALINLMVQ